MAAIVGALILAFASAATHGASLSKMTYLGGSGPDLAKAVAFDAAKNIYIASSTGSANFPGLAAGALSGFLYKGSMQCVVTKLDPTATHVLSTAILPPPGLSSAIYFDGVKNSDVAWKDRDCNPTAIRIDTGGNIFLAGSTGVLHIEGDGNHDSANLRGSMMGFVTKLDPGGKVIYSIVLGAYSNSRADGKNHYTGEKSRTVISSLALNASGQAYVGGWTDSQALPSTKGTMQEITYWNVVAGFLTEIDTDGTVMASTFLGGAPTNTDGFAATTHLNEITLDAAGNVTGVGTTDSQNLQISADAFNKSNEQSTSGFVEIISADLKKSLYGSFIHPDLDAGCLANLSSPFTKMYVAVTEATGVASDEAGNIFVTGTTTSPCLAVTNGAVQKQGRANSAGYLLRMNAKRSLDYATYMDLGGDTTSSLKVLVDKAAVAGSDTSLYLVHNSVGAQPAIWPTFSAPANQISHLKTANAFLEHLTIAADGSSSAVNWVSGFGGTFSTVMLGVAATDDGKIISVVGTTKTADLPITAGALSPSNNGASDGLLALFASP